MYSSGPNPRGDSLFGGVRYFRVGYYPRRSPRASSIKVQLVGERLPGLPWQGQSDTRLATHRMLDPSSCYLIGSFGQKLESFFRWSLSTCSLMYCPSYRLIRRPT